MDPTEHHHVDSFEPLSRALALGDLKGLVSALEDNPDALATHMDHNPYTYAIQWQEINRISDESLRAMMQVIHAYAGEKQKNDLQPAAEKAWSNRQFKTGGWLIDHGAKMTVPITGHVLTWAWTAPNEVQGARVNRWPHSLHFQAQQFEHRMIGALVFSGASNDTLDEFLQSMRTPWSLKYLDDAIRRGMGYSVIDCAMGRDVVFKATPQSMQWLADMTGISQIEAVLHELDREFIPHLPPYLSLLEQMRIQQDTPTVPEDAIVRHRRTL